MCPVGAAQKELRQVRRPTIQTDATPGTPPASVMRDARTCAHVAHLRGLLRQALQKV
jgi:hypothetical protein